MSAVGGGEAGQRVGEHVGARQARSVHRARRDDQRLGRIQTAGDADHGVFDARSPSAAVAKPWDLDVVGLVAVLAQPRGSAGTKGKRSIARRSGTFGRRVEAKRDGTEGCARPPSSPDAVAETVEPHALLADAAQIDIGGDRWVALEALALRQAVAHSKIAAWPSQARSVVDSPGPAAV